MTVFFPTQLAMSRLMAYTIFSSLLMILAFWRLYVRFPEQKPDTNDNSNNKVSQLHSEISFDAAMQDSYVVVGIFNMVLCLLIVSIKIFQHIFFGSLIGTEPQYLREKLTRFALFRVVFLVGVINATSWSSLLGWTLWFSCLGALHGFSRLACVRGEQLVVTINVTKQQWIRFSIMIFLIFGGVVTMLHTGINCCLYLSDVTPETDIWGFSDSSEKDKINVALKVENEAEEHDTDYYQLFNVLVFMITDCTLVTLLILQIVLTVIIHFIDRCELLGNRCSFNRTIWLYYVNLFCDLTGIFLDLTNHLHMLIWSRGLSLTSVIVILQLRVTYSELSQRMRRHSAYKQLVKFVRLEFPLEQFEKKVPESANINAEKEEQVPESCAICWEPLCVWRKLPCGHCFHETCLTRWMELNLSCPTCRRILNNASTSPQLQRQDILRQETSETGTLSTFFRDILSMTGTEMVAEAATAGTQTTATTSSPTVTTGQQLVRTRQANNSQTIFPLAMLPTVRAMAVRLRQHGGEGAQPLVNNPGPRLDLSIRVSVGPGMPVMQERRMQHIRSASADATTPDTTTQEDGSGNRESRGNTNITTNTATEGQTLHRQVMQSTIQSRFFRFDGSRYFSWLPNISIELSEIFGELITAPGDGENNADGHTNTPSQPSQTSANQEIPTSPPTHQTLPHATTEPTTDHQSQTSLLSRLLSAVLSSGEGVNETRMHQHNRPSNHHLGTELRRQAEQISTMFPAVPLNQILADLAVTGQAEVTVENVLSGQLQPAYNLLSSPSTTPVMHELNSTELQQQRQIVEGADEEHPRRIVAHPIRARTPSPILRNRRSFAFDNSSVEDLFIPRPSTSIPSPTTEASSPSPSHPNSEGSQESTQRIKRRRQMVIDGRRKLLARIGLHQESAAASSSSSSKTRGSDGDNTHS